MIDVILGGRLELDPPPPSLPPKPVTMVLNDILWLCCTDGQLFL